MLRRPPGQSFLNGESYETESLPDEVRDFALAAIVALTLYQPLRHVGAQKSEQPKTSHARTASPKAEKSRASSVARPAPPINVEYTARIKEYTTQPYFSTELVDYSACVRQSSVARLGSWVCRWCAGTPDLHERLVSLLSGAGKSHAARAGLHRAGEERRKQGTIAGRGGRRSKPGVPESLQGNQCEAADEKNLMISGMLAGGSELANAPAVVDVPVGQGHVVMFANNPMWRHQTQGSFFLLFNAILNYDHLSVGRGASVEPG